METWHFLVAGVGIISALFKYTHVRINQVRQEAIDIADRNQKDVNRVADLVRAEFTMKTDTMTRSHEKTRDETRQDLKEIDAKSERFRDEIREKLSDMESRILGAIRAPPRAVR